MNKKAYTFFALLLVISILASAIFTLADFIVHKSIGRDEFKVPLNYFTNKFLYSILGFALGFSIFRYIPSWAYAFAFGLLLQLRYYYIGFPVQFHVIFVPVHIILIYVILLVGRMII